MVDLNITRRQVLGGGLWLSAFAVARSGNAGSLPQRIVSMDLLATEMLLTLGLSPVAIANIALYRRLVAEPPLGPTTVDLGPLQEPNAEYLQLLRPDLIVMADWQASGLKTLKRIAPAYAVKSFPGKTPAVVNAQEQLLLLGDLTGRPAQARTWVERCDSEMESACRILAGSTQPPIYLCRFNQDARHVAIFAGNGLVNDVMTRLGLTNAWTGRVNASGVASIGIEQLAQNPQARIVHFDRGRETDLAMVRLAESSLWQALPAVVEKRITRMPVIYPSGGLVSAIRLARQLATSLSGGN